MKIFITSYTYIYEHNYRLFRYFKDRSNLVLILPKKWKSTKGNRTTIHAPEIKDMKIIATPTFFYHSRYPLIRGQLKGWMPFLWFILGRESKPGDVFFSSYEPNLLVTYIYGLIARGLRLKHVFFTWQNVPYRERMSGLKLKVIEWLLKKNIELSAAGVCGMKRAFEIHKGYFKKYGPTLKVGIFNQSGVDTDVFNPEAKSDFRYGYNLEDKIVITYSATFTPRKGTIETLEAFRILAKEMENARLVIIGAGELGPQVANKIREPDLTDKVIQLPWQPINDLAPIYAQSDIMIHPSVPFEGWEEQWGMLMLQAQACGTPVITSRTGSLEETVLDGKTGILVKPGDIRQIYEAMKKLALDPELRVKLGKAGREYMVEHFSYRSTAMRMEEFLNTL